MSRKIRFFVLVSCINILTIFLLFNLSYCREWYVVGNHPLLGNWNISQGLVLNDDGTTTDAVAGDGYYTATEEFEIFEPVNLEYKMTDGETIWIGTVTGKNMVIPFDKYGKYKVIFFLFLDNNDQSIHIGDSYNANYNKWIAVGSFQSNSGVLKNWDPLTTETIMNDEGIKGDARNGDFIFTYRFVSLANLQNSEWKVVRKGSWVNALKCGSNGWSYDPEDSFNAVFSADQGDTVVLEFNANCGLLKSHIREDKANTVLNINQTTWGEVKSEYK